MPFTDIREPRGGQSRRTGAAAALATIRARSAEHVRKLLLKSATSEPSAPAPPDPPAPALRLPDPGLLPLHRILLVDDNPARLAERVDEFRLHQFRLGFVVETAASGEDAVRKLQTERFEAVLIELGSPTEEELQMLERLRCWSTPLAPILLNSEGMEVLELRKLNRNLIRALAVGFGKEVPMPYRKRGQGGRMPRSPAKAPCLTAPTEEDRVKIRWPSASSCPFVIRD